ncbi:taste receptor type 2 member 9-like [Mixophyes fleayi]|uniref:taste receptor type 2 member 9-like n=1 Tax=Mixophyes fleayi TaxID=3061075 RepID=UPI003F4D9595
MSEIAVIHVALHSIFLVTGLTGNIFILIVHFLDWQKTRDLNPCNLILNVIGIFNIMLQGIIVLQEIAYAMFKEIYLLEWVSNLVQAVSTSASLSSLWCSTCLCFYYCVKIVNLSGTFFCKLKAKLPLMVPWLLFLSIVLSWGAGMSVYWDMYIDIVVTPLNITGNITLMSSNVYFSKCNCMFQMFMLIVSVAFTIISLTTVAIITSLFNHMRRMRQNNEGFGQARITSHLSAAKTVTALLINYLIVYCVSILLSYSLIMPDELTITVCYIVLSSFPTINAAILILGNRKLTNVLKKLLGMKSIVANTEITVTAS